MVGFAFYTIRNSMRKGSNDEEVIEIYVPSMFLTQQGAFLFVGKDIRDLIRSCMHIIEACD
jgi:hypothetical protein